MKKLLVINCSEAKDENGKHLPAIERYNGVAFRVLRKFLKQNQDPNLDTFIISAKFGLISSQETIPYYNQKISPILLRHIQPSVVSGLKTLLEDGTYQDCLFCLSKDYLKILGDLPQNVPETISLEVATGTIGRKLSLLHTWLYGKPPQYLHAVTSDDNGKATLKGVTVELSQAEVLEVARKKLRENRGKPHNYQSWYVTVDDQRVSPKWLVSELTGLPVSAFHSIEARRFLQKLGISINFES